MTDRAAMPGGIARSYSVGAGEVCRCGAALPARDGAWGCTECGGDCCADCAFWLESTVYCPECTDRLLAA